MSCNVSAASCVPGKACILGPSDIVLFRLRIADRTLQRSIFVSCRGFYKRSSKYYLGDRGCAASSV
jgi:hypothetical protein